MKDDVEKSIPQKEEVIIFLCTYVYLSPQNPFISNVLFCCTRVIRSVLSLIDLIPDVLDTGYLSSNIITAVQIMYVYVNSIVYQL